MTRRRLTFSGVAGAAAGLCLVVAWLLRHPAEGVAAPPARAKPVFPIDAPIERPFATAGVPAFGAASAPVARTRFAESVRAPFLVSGVLLDQDGEPVAGATVAVYVKPPAAASAPIDASSVVFHLSSRVNHEISLALFHNVRTDFNIKLEADFGDPEGIGRGLNRHRYTGPDSAFGGTSSDAASPQGLTLAIARGFAWESGGSAEAPSAKNQDGLAPSGSEVRTEFQATTDAEGRFSISGEAQEGALSLRAAAPCCFTESPTLFAAQAEGVVVRAACRGALEGRFTYEGKPVKTDDLRILVVDGSGAARCIPASDAEGRFRADGLAGGVGRLEFVVDEAWTPAFLVPGISLSAKSTVNDPRIDPLELCGDLRRIRLRAVDDSGRPVSGAWVKRSEPFRSAASPMGMREPRCKTPEMRSDAAGVLDLFVRKDGNDLAVGADGYAAVGLSGVSTDVVAVLRRYRIADLSWAEPAVIDELAAALGDSSTWVLRTQFTPSTGGAGWMSVASGAPFRFYCETAGRLSCTLALRTEVGPGRTPIVEALHWSTELDVADLIEPQRFRLNPPSMAEALASLARLEERVRVAREELARRAVEAAEAAALKDR